MVGFHDATFLYIRLYYIHLINIYIIIYVYRNLFTVISYLYIEVK